MTERVMIASLLKLELPGHTVRLIDAGTLPVRDEVYSSRDALIGVPMGFEQLSEGVGDEGPAGMLTFAPPQDVPATSLNDPAFQGSRLRLYIAEVDPDTGACIGEPDQICDWIVDHTVLRLSREGRLLDVNCVPMAQRVKQMNQGNCLSPVFHRGIYPGEAGLDNASGTTVDVAWAAAAPARGARS